MIVNENGRGDKKAPEVKEVKDVRKAILQKDVVTKNAKHK